MVHIQTNFTAEAMNTGKKAEAVAPVKAKAKKEVKPEPVVVETPVVEEVVETPVAEEALVVEEAPVNE